MNKVRMFVWALIAVFFVSCDIPYPAENRLCYVVSIDDTVKIQVKSELERNVMSEEQITITAASEASFYEISNTQWRHSKMLSEDIFNFVRLQRTGGTNPYYVIPGRYVGIEINGKFVRFADLLELQQTPQIPYGITQILDSLVSQSPGSIMRINDDAPHVVCARTSWGTNTVGWGSFDAEPVVTLPDVR